MGNVLLYTCFSVLERKTQYFKPKRKSLWASTERRDWCNAALQGSFSISYPDGKLQTFNYAGLSKRRQVNCAPYHRFTKVDEYDSKRLVVLTVMEPLESTTILRSIAVDPQRIPYGRFIYPQSTRVDHNLLQGKVLRTTVTFSQTTREAIKEDHIDVYVGNEKHKELSAFIKQR